MSNIWQFEHLTPDKEAIFFTKIETEIEYQYPFDLHIDLSSGNEENVDSNLGVFDENQSQKQ